MAISNDLNARHCNLSGSVGEVNKNLVNLTNQSGGAWSLYDDLLADIPDDVLVCDYVLGVNWSFLEAECGAGVSYTLGGGAKAPKRADYRGKPLKSIASLAKSWCFEEATIGVAALNAWYGRIEHVEEMGAAFSEHCKMGSCATCNDERRAAINCQRTTDAFDCYKPQIEMFISENGHRAKVVVVGHFPHVEDIVEYADLTVLERNCKNDIDTPDPGCEYIMPDADYAFLTGVTLINKTMPRLLQLSKNAKTTVVGPSAVASPTLFEYGVNTIAGRCVVDPERARFSAATSQPFGSALQPFIINKL